MHQTTLNLLKRHAFKTLVVLAVFMFGMAISTLPAAAGEKNHTKQHYKPAKMSRTPVGDVIPSKYAAIVVDADNGRVLEDVNSTALRHPASLTKIMTLYVVFAQLATGKVDMNDSLLVSRHADRQPPSDVNLRAGDYVRLGDAVMALVTESANDAAVTIAENIAGSEENFAVLMNKTARKLGMKRTVFKNASGLPDPRQVTTARDMAILARSLINHFPDDYRLFSTAAFNFRGAKYHNHNRLMQRYEGMDGIKTGYIRASGFNLVASAVRDDRRLIAVVFGGTSAARRDNRMAQILDRNFAKLNDLPRIQEVQNNTIPVRNANAARPSIQAATDTSGPKQEVADSLSTRGLSTLIVSQAQAAPLVTATQPRQQTAQLESLYRHPDPAVAAGNQMVAKRSQPPTMDLRTATIEKHLLQPATWNVQIGAYKDQQTSIEAAKKTAAAVARMSGRKVSYDVLPVKTAGGSLYQGRLTGLDETSALTVCRSLAAQGRSCAAREAE